MGVGNFGAGLDVITGMKHLLVGLTLIVGYLVAMPTQHVGADCVGPTIVHDTGTFAADDQLDIEGFAFGTNCYDTGPPPEGEGVLGVPVSGIEILLVQGDLVIPVAAGDADGNYEFMVSVTVPSDLEPGEFSILATGPQFGEAWNQTQGVLSFVGSGVVSPAVVVDFEPSTASVPQPSEPSIGEEEPQEATLDAPFLLLVGAGVLIALLGAGVVAWRLNRRPV